ncbi:MAG: hypothetical protein COY39_00735 [Alphaproteobacteria bacterium CG_4_10_14_0_8_um_filter_37_21]|nr:MAG: hypothetical protein COY39_00735 [Alphaproteobacteria bacterium CG_4_10_14_0_8_um_filter_37_21]
MFLQGTFLILLSFLSTLNCLWCAKNVGNTKAIVRLNGTAKHKFPDADFPFANTQAPKGGKLRLATQGTFDSLNRFSIHGTTPDEVLILQYDMLMFRAPDEPFTLYPLLAESAHIAPDSSSITFKINPKAKFADGSAVQAKDVKASMEHLRDKGKPRYKMSFGPVERIDMIDDLTIKVHFSKKDDGTYDPERPLVVAYCIVLPKKDLEKTDIGAQSNQPIQGTGPYKIKSFEHGHFIEMERRDDYWAKDYLKGFFNFDSIRLDYFKTSQAQFQGFQAGAYDIFFETNPQNWKRGFDFPAAKDGRVVKFEAEHTRGVLSRYFIVNMRRPIFQDIRLRKAISLAFDADTVNRRVYEGDMKIPQSTFANTIYAHKGKAEGSELEILTKYKNRIGDRFHDITNSAYVTPQTKSPSDHRAYIKQAAILLDGAGYKVKNGVRCAKDGKPLEFSLMVKDEKLEKIALSYAQNLKLLGIQLFILRVDTVQYENRILESDFDIIIHAIYNGMSPGVEQTYYYGAKFANIKGSSNYIGLSDEILEDLAYDVATAATPETHIAACHAMDRYLMHLYCFIPIMYDNKYREARWVGALETPDYDPEMGRNVMAFGWSGSADKQLVNGNTDVQIKAENGFFQNSFNKIYAVIF